MSAPIILPLEWAVIEHTSGTAVYRVALVATEADAKVIAKALKRAAASGYVYTVEPATPAATSGGAA